MQKTYYIDLNINVDNALNNDFNLDNFRKKPIAFWHYPKNKLSEIFNVHWLNDLKSLGLEINSSLVFFRESYNFYKMAHIDVKTNPLRTINYAVNFIYDKDDDSEMIWYELGNNDPGIEDTIEYHENGIPNCEWNIETFNGKEVARKTIGRNLVLVNTSIPHTVQTFKKERLAFSLRFSDFTEKSWSEAIQKLSEYTR